jgi:putative membrane protein
MAPESTMANSRSDINTREHQFNLILLGVLFGTVIWSGILPYDRQTWAMEVTPVVIGVGVLMATYRGFRFTRLPYVSVFLAGVLICIGGHWTFARVPIGNWAKDAFDLSRNHFDRIGHFMQGVFSALIVREMVLRRSGVRRGLWLFLLVTASSLAIGALFEFIEWFVAVAIGDGSQAYLSTQGDEWDAHWDMLLAFIGAMGAQRLLAGVQDRQLRGRGLALDR